MALVPTAKELMRAGELYPGDDPALNRELDERQALVAALNAIPHERIEERFGALKELLAGIGEGTLIRPPFYCDFGDGIRIGAGTFINFNCIMHDAAPIAVGGECLPASSVQLITATHPVDPVARRAAWEQARPVTIADGVWCRHPRMPRRLDRGEHRRRRGIGCHARPARRGDRLREPRPRRPRDRRAGHGPPVGLGEGDLARQPSAPETAR